MKINMILKSLLIVTILLSGCNKDDDKKEEQGCAKEENFFELKMEKETFEPYFLIAGGLNFYTLNVTRCSQSSNDWSISINTEEGVSIYLYVIGASQPGNYPFFTGNNTHIPAICFEKISLYI